jgi:hypothetical protein
MFGDRLPRHVEVRAQFTQRLPVALMQLVQQLASAFVRQGFKYYIHLENTLCNHLVACQVPIEKYFNGKNLAALEHTFARLEKYLRLSIGK